MAGQAEALQMNMELTNLPGTSLKVSPVAIGLGPSVAGCGEEQMKPSQSRPSAPHSSMASTLSIPPRSMDWPFRGDRRQGNRRRPTALSSPYRHQDRTGME